MYWNLTLNFLGRYLLSLIIDTSWIAYPQRNARRFASASRSSNGYDTFSLNGKFPDLQDDDRPELLCVLMLRTIRPILPILPQQNTPAMSSLTFVKTSVAPSFFALNTAYLRTNNWDDFSYKTTFALSVVDESGVRHDLGEVKIGYVGQQHGWTAEALNETFTSLGDEFFSLGQSPSYYEQLGRLPRTLRMNITKSLQDIVANPNKHRIAENYDVFSSSLTRFVSDTSIREQFNRLLSGGDELSAFEFSFFSSQSDKRAAMALSFEVEPHSTPSTNIHVLIGRNGIGKTTLLNGMIESLVESRDKPIDKGFFLSRKGGPTPIPKDFFSGLVSVSFSAFDPFIPPKDQEQSRERIGYSYIGLKTTDAENSVGHGRHKGIEELSKTFVDSLESCFSLRHKKEQWLRAISFLESDLNFLEMNLSRLAEVHELDVREKLQERAAKFYEQMSSGHAIVLLTITKLIECAEEKTLLIMDEPESHLHPPLLSALTRALADLLHTLNGVAIIATHSPVVLQEVPKSCVWKIARSKLQAKIERPEIETFGENVGILTREVFQLEVSKSGFYALLEKSVNEGKGFEEIISQYNDQIGFEGRALLHALIANRG